MNRPWPTQRPLRWIAVFSLLLFGASCNILSWTHDEGGSDEPETLLQDAEDALLDGNFTEALEFAKAGIAKDPAPMEFPRLRYVASQAVLAKSNISVVSYLNALTSNSSAPKAGTGRGPIIQDGILDLTLAELQAIAEACPQAVAFLAELLDALESGDIAPADLLGIQFDVNLGFAVGSLLTAFVTALDNDQDLSNGFTRNPLVTIQANEGEGYVFDYTGPIADRERFIRCQLACPILDLFCAALEGMYDAYRATTAPVGWPADLNCSLANGVRNLPGVVNRDFVIGQALEFVHAGITRIFTDWAAGCTACATQTNDMGGTQ